MTVVSIDLVLTSMISRIRILVSLEDFYAKRMALTKDLHDNGSFIDSSFITYHSSLITRVSGSDYVATQHFTTTHA